MYRAPKYLVLLALLAAGCGDDDAKDAASTPATPAATATATAVPDDAELREHLMVKGDLDAGDPTDGTVVTNPEDWATGLGEESGDRIRVAGFVAGIRQDHLQTGELLGAAVSTAVRFKDSGGAESEVEAATAAIEGVEITEFDVPSIPGAAGFSASDGTSTGNNVAFAVGEIFHLVGAEEDRASRKQVVAAAEKLYERVK